MGRFCLVTAFKDLNIAIESEDWDREEKREEKIKERRGGQIRITPNTSMKPASKSTG
jgi:hypothetical protein